MFIINERYGIMNNMQSNHPTKMAEIASDNALLARVRRAFHAETGLQLDLKEVNSAVDGHHVDAIVTFANTDKPMAVEVKKWAQHANLGALIEQLKRLPVSALLVADYINPKMAEKLKAADTQFLDAAGNAYINQPPIYVYMVGNKPSAPQTKPGRNRAFDVAGLKLIFGLLCNLWLINKSYREIAEHTGVALGTVGEVIAGLKASGFVIDHGRSKPRRLVEMSKLLDRWVDTYPEKLKPKLWLGDYVGDDVEWWQKVDLKQYHAYWSGEVAAAKYTDYLRPQDAIIYLPEEMKNRFLSEQQLRKKTNRYSDAANSVSVYESLWITDKQNQDIIVPNVVNPILAYADLVATGDSRNLETARMIYDQYIAQHFGKA